MAEKADLEQRLADLEARYAHQEQALSDLSDTTAEQWDVIEALKRRLEQFQSRLTSVEQGDHHGGDGNERPPHY
ncbi:MAG: SlyX family protein [Rhodospirillaceae bacterium]|jgi:SlyX protein|nr:SlyX family protein [Rhodospirillaceae bacterium]MBT3908454.1 SlyX family protein [Rhodospirillaceae bacterium]MBT5300217.1 SlyX family protein [Rhodospirillaceae bacterium]MBT5516028.1 SlyX family protein [Rhodospirillaceae bacterium]MBT6086256.1 SlyX family protein [Rhodospirillaceae bacterium]